jgi:hypothetical protein
MRSTLIATLATAGLLMVGFTVPAMAAETTAVFPTSTADSPCSSLAQIETRPNITNSVCVVGKDHQELEAGFGYLKADGTKLYSYPNAELRIGSDIKNLEFQIVAPSVTHAITSSSSSGALGDAAIGAKYLIGASKNYAHSVQVQVGLPVGDSASYAESASYQGEYRFNHVFSATGMVEFVSNTASGGGSTVRYGSFIPSLKLNATLANDWGIFAEGAMNQRPAGQGTRTNTYDAGVAKSIGSRVRLDAEYTSVHATTPSASATAHGFGAGVAFYR